MKTKFLIIAGIVMIIIGFITAFSRTTYFLPPTEPPIMRPLEGVEYLVVMYGKVFLLIGIIGTVVTITGVILWRKRK